MKKIDTPTISFVTPNFNDGKTIERQVDSIMDQDYKNVEQIIVDDGSTDDSKKVLKKLQKKYKNRLKIIYLNNNVGACEARNVGAKEAKGKYLSFLPADAYLYPGVARIWVETLEKNPTYDFLYGAYKVTDENYHELMSYMSDEFDPYTLKITNYIDGSFPLKKELFDKIGGWDVQIKSLQDWDLWLNAVLNHNAKGLFRKEVFFETTAPHPGGLSDDSHRNWIARTDQIKTKYGIKKRKICVTGPGASFHAKNVAKLLDADYLPMPSFKPHNYEMIYVIGFFGEVGQAFYNTNCLRVLHWIGSDILSLQQQKPELQAEVIGWLDNNIDINLCEMEATQKELAALGIKAKIIPFPPQKLYEPLPLPEKPGVAVYLPFNNKDFYYPEFVYRIAKKMPDVNFHYFGDPMHGGIRKNEIHHGVVSGEEKEKLLNDTSMILRLTPHDGLPLSVIEWITAGRQAVTTTDIPYAYNFKIEKTKKLKPNKKELEKVLKANEKKIVTIIRKALAVGQNKQGSRYYNNLCDPDTFKEKIHNFLKIDLKEWWKEMSDLWPQMESSQETTEDIIKIMKEVKKLKPKNVVDLGCGTGRFVDILPVEDYTGVDFAKGLIKVAKKNHKDGKFLNMSILELAEKIEKGKMPKFDVVFTFASLLHVKPDEFKVHIEALKKIANKAILVEPVRDVKQSSKDRMIHPGIIKKQREKDFVFNVKYTWIHDYMGSFDVKKVVPLSNNRELFVINL